MLLPNRTKILGISIGVISLLIGIILKYQKSEPAEVYALLTYSGMILGLLLITLSREKIEDEMIDNLRAKSMQFAFIFAAVSTIVRPIVDLAFGDPIELEKAHEVVFVMLLMYNLCFIYLKKKA